MARNGRVRVSRSGDGEPPEDSRDRISALPDSVLHLILVLVPLVDAVRTCVLSRRWRSVWTRLPLLAFDDVLPRVSRFPDLVDGVLRGYDDDVDMEDLFVAVYRRGSVPDDPVPFVATLADIAAPRVSGRFGLYLSPTEVNLYAVEEDEAAALQLQLPCFPRVTELDITFMGVDLIMPTIDTFAKLTTLIITGARFTDGGAGLSQVVSLGCPCIQTLELHAIHGLRWLTITARSLVRMVLSGVLSLEQLLLEARNLRQMQVDNCFVLSKAPGYMFLWVPALEHLVWQDRCPEMIQHSMLPSRIHRLVVADLDIHYYVPFGVGGRSNFAGILELFKGVDTLRFQFPTQDRTEQDNLIENINPPRYSELEFVVNHTSHKFGPTVVNLLRKCSYVKKVTLQMFGREAGHIPCDSDCNCRQISVWWTDNTMTLDSLEWVAMHEFSATQDEKSLIYYIMRNARHLRKVFIVFSLVANPTRRFYRKLGKLAALSGCDVECYSHY